MVTIDMLVNCGWPVNDNFLIGLSDYERDFLRLEFTGIRTRQYYADRIKYHGLTGNSFVLDAGCGMGQWTSALSLEKSKVIGRDLNQGRLEVGRKLLESLHIKNTQLFLGDIENINYPDNTFDLVFCYGVFMFTEMPKTLSEFARVLRPGGKLYLNANSFGWYVHLVRDVPWNRKPALRIIKNTILGDTKSIIVRENWLRKILRESNFEIVSLGTEGSTSFLKEGERDTKPLPGYKEYYLGLRSMIEICAVSLKNES